VSRFVLDATITIAWCFTNEATEFLHDLPVGEPEFFPDPKPVVWDIGLDACWQAALNSRQAIIIFAAVCQLVPTKRS
jgi:hypothetical protein